MSARDLALDAREASRVLAGLGSDARAAALRRCADALIARQDEILAANADDVADGEVAVGEGRMSSALARRLVLSPAKLETLADGLRTLASAPEPIGRVLQRREVADGLVLSQETWPIGVLLVIFESRPDALVQIAGLALRSGNGLLLKGGKEAARSNRALHRVLIDALAPDVPAGVIGLVESRDEIAALLALDEVIDLVIPRGSGALVRYVQANTKIPVLGHADGICHVFVDAAAEPDMAEAIVLDAKCDYPAACNAMETLLVHAAVADTLGVRLVDALRSAGVRLVGGPRAVSAYGLDAAPSLALEHGDLAATIEVVDDVRAAIDHIHRYGSGHTDAVVTADADVARAFLDGVDSACVFHNASTRFADGYRFGLGAEVGISTGRIHARGPVGVEGLLTTRWKLLGHGDTVGPFSHGERAYTHRDLDPQG